MIQAQSKILAFEQIWFCVHTEGYKFRMNTMMFSHKERLFPSVLSCSFINRSSYSCYVCPAPQQESQIFCSSPFQGKDVGR
jgi:hypothetical protein